MDESDQVDDVEFVPIRSDLLSALDQTRGNLSRNDYLSFLLSQSEEGRSEEAEFRGRTDGGQTRDGLDSRELSGDKGFNPDTVAEPDEESVDPTEFKWQEGITNENSSLSTGYDGNQEPNEDDSILESGFNFGVTNSDSSAASSIPNSSNEPTASMGQADNKSAEEQPTGDSSVEVSRLSRPEEWPQSDAGVSGHSHLDSDTVSLRDSRSGHRTGYTVGSFGHRESVTDVESGLHGVERSVVGSGSQPDTKTGPWRGVTGRDAEPWCRKPSTGRDRGRNHATVGSFQLKRRTDTRGERRSQPDSGNSRSSGGSGGGMEVQQTSGRGQSKKSTSSSSAPEAKTTSEQSSLWTDQKQSRKGEQAGREKPQPTVEREQSKATSGMFLSRIGTSSTSPGDVPVTWGIVSWALAVGVYGGGDLVTTWFALAAGAGEANPLMSAVMGVNPLLGILVKSVIFIVLFVATHSLSSKESENNQLAVAVPMALVVIGGYATIRNIGNIPDGLLEFVLIAVVLLSVSGGAAVALYHDMQGTIADHVSEFTRSSPDRRLSTDGDITGSYRTVGGDKSEGQQSADASAHQQGQRAQSQAQMPTTDNKQTSETRPNNTRAQLTDSHSRYDNS